MKVFDLFPFYNELDLLELRVSELDPIVDWFCSVELPVTFTGLPKPNYMLDSWRPKKYGGDREVPYDLNKFSVLRGVTVPVGPHPTVDWFQRGLLAKALISLDAAPDDIVMLSDVDEIPNREVVKRLIDAGIDEPLCLQSKLYYHRVDLYDPSGPWSGTIIAPRRCVRDTQELRNRRCSLPQIPDAGWHFSWLGDERAIADKLLAVDIERDSNDQMKNPGQNLEFLRSCYETGKDLFGRKDHDKVRVPIIPGANQPHEIGPWLDKYPQYAAVDHVAY